MFFKVLLFVLFMGFMISCGDLDRDKDGVINAIDAFPSDPAASVDADGDGYPDKWNEGQSAGDSTSDPKLILDAFPEDKDSWLDADGDKIPRYRDIALYEGNDLKYDPDDTNILIPNGPEEDFDRDGIKNKDDAFLYDPAASVDTDGDGYPDEWNVGKSATDSTSDPKLFLDSFPNDPNEWMDGDGDGTGDNSDKFPLDPAASVDTDGDDYPDKWNEGKSAADSTSDPKLSLDSFPNDQNSWIDGDGDGFRRYRDEVIYTGSDKKYDPDDSDQENPFGVNGDEDGDGVRNKDDAFPNDPAASIDSDGDDYPDRWNDGKSATDSTSSPPLVLDVFPNDSTEWLDSDIDGVGDNGDSFPNDLAASVDTDGDGYPDEWNSGKSQVDSTSDPQLELDAFVNDATEWVDTDGDGVGDNGDEFPRDSSATSIANYYINQSMRLDMKVGTGGGWAGVLPEIKDMGKEIYLDFSTGLLTAIPWGGVAPDVWDLCFTSNSRKVTMGPMGEGDSPLMMIKMNHDGGVRYYMEGTQVVEKANVPRTEKEIRDILAVGTSFMAEASNGYGHRTWNDNEKLDNEEVKVMRQYPRLSCDWYEFEDMKEGILKVYNGRVFVFKTQEDNYVKFSVTGVRGVVDETNDLFYGADFKYHYGLSMDGVFSY